MEMSEDYTCIIAHGPNPKTTHIYGDRVLECQKNEVINREKQFETELESMFPTDHFLSVCDFCNKKLEVGYDIYMYRCVFRYQYSLVHTKMCICTRKHRMVELPNLGRSGTSHA